MHPLLLVQYFSNKGARAFFFTVPAIWNNNLSTLPFLSVSHLKKHHHLLLFQVCLLNIFLPGGCLSVACIT